ncbi:MAG: hypothetical protein RL640_687, partial [Bacteroidota bacterium]
SDCTNVNVGFVPLEGLFRHCYLFLCFLLTIETAAKLLTLGRFKKEFFQGKWSR